MSGAGRERGRLCVYGVDSQGEAVPEAGDDGQRSQVIRKFYSPIYDQNIGFQVALNHLPQIYDWLKSDLRTGMFVYKYKCKSLSDRHTGLANQPIGVIQYFLTFIGWFYIQVSRSTPIRTLGY